MLENLKNNSVEVEPLEFESTSQVPMVFRDNQSKMLIADINGANTYFAPYDPMRGLLAAILERAVRDLRDHEEKHRESARNWFNGVDVDGETHFTFSDVCHYLGLTHAQILFVLKLSSESTAQ